MILTGELFAKAFQRLPTSILANNNLCVKVVSSPELPTLFDDSLKTTSVSIL